MNEIDRIHGKEEYILCAAVHYFDDKAYLSQPKNITTGYVICGYRHDRCIKTHMQLVGKKTTYENSIQGFLTSKDRFVDREEAGKIAYAVKQIKNPTPMLFSEDLY